MLNHDESPAAWALLLYELDDARDHLAGLIKHMADAGRIDPQDFRIRLGHVYAHLNRVWNSRCDPDFDSISQEQQRARSRFPDDLDPL